MAEMLGRTLESARRCGILNGIKLTSRMDNVAHHQFVDDNIFVGKAVVREASRFKEILGHFEKATNQKISLKKSNVFFINTPGCIQGRISRILRMDIKKLPIIYLGLPLFVGKMTKDMWNPLIDKMQRKLVGWKGALLSLAGKFQLVASMLQSIPIFWMSIFRVPPGISDTIESIQKRFLWSRTESKDKIQLVSWSKVCTPKWAGGLNLRRLSLFNTALGAKLGWRLLKGGERQWEKILSRKYI